MLAIILNGMLLLFEVAARKIRWALGWCDFVAPLERMDWNFLVLCRG